MVKCIIIADFELISISTYMQNEMMIYFNYNKIYIYCI